MSVRARCVAIITRACVAVGTRSYAESVGATHFLTSAKQNKGLDNVFVDLVKRESARRGGGAGRARSGRPIMRTHAPQKCSRIRRARRRVPAAAAVAPAAAVGAAVGTAGARARAQYALKKTNRQKRAVVAAVVSAPRARCSPFNGV